MDTTRAAGNLSDEGQNRRLRGGVIALGVALTLAVLMLKLGAPVYLRLLLVGPFFSAANGLFQGLHRT